MLEHPLFGLGVVLAVRGEKMDVQFRAGLKTLAQARGSAHPAHRLGEPAREPEGEETQAEPS